MEKFTRIILRVMLLPLIGIIASCADESDCSLVSRATLNGNIYQINSENEVSKFNLPLLTIRGLVSASKDTVILNQKQDAEIFDFPLQYTVDTTAIVFQYNEILRDTIVLRHTNTPYFVSVECGYDMKQVVTSFSYTRNYIDSISLIKNNTNKDGNENLRIFYIADE